jgi:hypothetical protein
MTTQETETARAWLADSLGLEFAPEALQGPLAAVRQARDVTAGARLPFEVEPSAAERLREDLAPERRGDE